MLRSKVNKMFNGNAKSVCIFRTLSVGIKFLATTLRVIPKMVIGTCTGCLTIARWQGFCVGAFVNVP